jgi:nucleoside 2-deoxyribosyltransferase
MPDLLPPTVYLAGPTVFEPGPDAIFAMMKAICARHGLRGVSPLDNQIGLEGVAPGHALATRIVQADIALMREVDAGVFCLDGFRRGPEMDPGTAFEIGYMHALGKPLAGWTRDRRPYPERVRAFFADTFGQVLQGGPNEGAGARSGALRDPDGILVHSEGCKQNAMTQVGIELSGGAVHAAADWTTAFEQAVVDLARRLPASPTQHEAQRQSRQGDQ